MSHIPNITVIAVLGTGLLTLLFLAGLKKIGAVRTILLYSTISVFGILFAGVFLAEEITLIDAVSLSITLVGIFFLRNKLAEAESDESPPNLISHSTPQDLEMPQNSKPSKILQVLNVVT